MPTKSFVGTSLDRFGYLKEGKMEFHETRMGHEFYLGTMPKLVRAIEETNNRLAGIIEKLDNGEKPEKAYPYSNHRVEDSVIDAAIEKAEDDKEGSFFAGVVEAIALDRDATAACLFTSYRNASAEERRIIDGVFAELTGWSLATLIRRYAEKGKTND